MDIHFDGQYDQQVFLKALRLVQRRTWVNQALRYAALAAALILSATFVQTWVTTGSAEGYRLAVAGLLFAFFIYPLVNTGLVVMRLFKERPLRSIGGRADSAGIVLLSKMSPGKRRQIPWKEFRRAGHTEGLTGLLAADGTLWVFRRDFFGSESDWNRFRQLVKKNITATK